MKVLANDGISASAKAALEAEGIFVSTDHVEQSQLIDTLNAEGYAGILVRSATKVRKDLIDACPDLRFIGRGGVGMDNIDVDYARGRARWSSTHTRRQLPECGRAGDGPPVRHGPLLAQKLCCHAPTGGRNSRC